MFFNDNILSSKEKIIFSLRELYLKNNYKPFKMSKFEEYDLYAKNKEFLVSDNVITFTDTNGKLLALKPDVTLSIIKNSKDDLSEVCKVFYAENVYRVSKGSNSYQEIMQTGLECFGNISKEDELQVINLALESLSYISTNCTLSISNLDIVDTLINNLNLSSNVKMLLIKAINEKNSGEILQLLKDNERLKEVNLILDIISIFGDLDYSYTKINQLAKKYNTTIFDEFLDKIKQLKKLENAKYITIDFSILNDVNYYNGIVFKGFIKGIPNAVVSGGCYDKLMKKLGRL